MSRFSECRHTVIVRPSSSDQMADIPAPHHRCPELTAGPIAPEPTTAQNALNGLDSPNPTLTPVTTCSVPDSTGGMSFPYAAFHYMFQTTSVHYLDRLLSEEGCPRH